MKMRRLSKEELVGRPWLSVTRKGKEYDLMPALIVIALLLLWSAS